MPDALLSVRDLEVRFWTGRGIVHAVNGVSFEVRPGETLGIVGESGCGKSVTALALLGLLPRAGRVRSGTAQFDGRDLLRLNQRALRRVRGRQIAMIFQDPMTSLNPVLTIGRQLREPLETHFGMSRKAAAARAAELLDRVGIPNPDMRLSDYPHQFSGGMRQRAMIAMALACRPKLMIADEPTTALDVTIQAQILALLKELVAEERTALILITHDLGVVAAKAVGVRRPAILFSHILPNGISPVIVQGTLAMATAIIDVAGLGFLGLGPQDPATPEWGTMLTDVNDYLQTAPWLAIVPGVAIVISVLGFNLIGDGLREALDPKLRGRVGRFRERKAFWFLGRRRRAAVGGA